MERLNAFVVLAVVSCPLPSGAEDKKEVRPLVDEAAYLKENSGKSGWTSKEVAITRDNGADKARGKLQMVFGAEKGKPSGGMLLRIDHGNVTVASLPLNFELVEKNGKRYLKISEVKFIQGKRQVLAPDTTQTLEYAIEAGKLTITSGIIRRIWAGYSVDFTKGITFNEAGQ